MNVAISCVGKFSSYAMSLIGTTWLSEFRNTVVGRAIRTITDFLETTSGRLSLLVDDIDGLYERRVIFLGRI